MVKSWKCLICGRATYKPPVILPQGAIGPVCAAKVAPKLPMGRAKKLVSPVPAFQKRSRWHDDCTADLFGHSDDHAALAAKGAVTQ